MFFETLDQPVAKEPADKRPNLDTNNNHNPKNFKSKNNHNHQKPFRPSNSKFSKSPPHQSKFNSDVYDPLSPKKIAKQLKQPHNERSPFSS
jgi:acid phosphatase class B